MAVYTKESKINEPIFEDPSIVAVINRFGLYLGVGDKSIGESCEKHGIDTDFFLAIINTYLNPDYLPEKIIDKRYLGLMVDYLEKTDKYYKDIQLPNIDSHFNLLLRNESESISAESQSNLELLNKFYAEVKDEMNQNITTETEFWFPLIRHNCQEAKKLIRIGEGEFKGVRLELPFDHSGLEDKIRDLISFFVIHLKGVKNHNLLMAVVSAIFVLEKDIKQNNRIRNRIFRPLCEN